MLHKTVRRISKPLLILPFGVKQNQVAGNVLHLLFGPLLHLLPGTCTQLIQFRRFAALFSLIFGKLVEGVDAYKNNIVVLINQFNGLLDASVHLCTYQSAELPHTVIDVYDIVAAGKLVKLLKRKRYLARTGLFAFQVELMETVKQLMIRKQTNLQRIVCKPAVDSPVYRSKGDILLAVFKYDADTGSLLFHVAEDIQRITLFKESMERAAYQIEILMINRLRARAE